MFAGLRKFIGFAPKKRSLEAAGGGRRWKDDRSGVGDANSWTLAGASKLAARATYYAINSAHGARIVESLAGNMVGCGIIPRSQAVSVSLRERLAVDWAYFVDNADADGLCDLYGLQFAAVRDLVTLGESLFSVRSEAGMPVLRRLHPEQLDRSKTLNLGDGGVVVQGVEIGLNGRVRAYWIHPQPLGHAIGSLALTSVRHPASEIIHVFRPLLPGQVRGLSWFAPILLPARELDSLLDAMLVRSKVAAMFVGSIVDLDGTGPGEDGEQTGSTLDVGVEPGAIRIEKPGKKLEWSEPPTAGDAPKLATETLRMIASGAGITYEQLTGDYSQVNYSSARAALLEFRRFCESVQHHVLAFQMCRPIWRRFMQWEVLKGVISATAYRGDPAAVEAVQWLPPKWEWVDPLKDAQAAILEIENNLTSRARLVAERGYDVEELDAEIAADRAREAKLGIEKRITNNAA